MPITPMVSPSDGMSEMLDRYNRITEQMCSSFDFDVASKTLAAFASRFDGIAKSMSPAFSKPFQLDLFNTVSTDALERINAAYKTIDFSAFDRLASICDRLSTFSTPYVAPEAYIEDETLVEDISASIADAKPFMTPAQQQVCEEQTTPAHTRKLSLSDALAILSILVTIVFGLIQQLPDKQLDAIIDQQETMIEMEREQNAALISAINSLNATVGRLSDEIEVLQNCLDVSTADSEQSEPMK